MSRAFRLAMLLGLLLVLGLHRRAGGAPTASEVDRAVEQLGSVHYRTRQKASALLWAAGKAAEPALQKALTSPDPEVVRRARDILEKFKYDIYPDTPKKVVTLIKGFRSGNDDDKRTAMKELHKLGSPGHAVLIRLAALEEEGAFRQELFHLLIDDVVPALLERGRHDAVAQVLELGVKNGDDQAFRHYAAYLFLRGQLDATIPRWAKQAKKLTGYRANEVLMYLYRAKGDLKNACLAARQTDKKHLVASILIEQGHWRELAANPEAPYENAGPLEQRGLTAAYHRLADNAREFEKALTAIRKFSPHSDEFLQARCKALLLNDRPNEAIDLLKGKQDRSFAFDLLAAQQRYQEAFALAASKKPAEEDEPIALARARTHAYLGNKDKARKILADLFAKYASAKDSPPDLNVIGTEYQLDFKEQAFAHGAQVVAQVDKEGRLEGLFGAVFPAKETEAEIWWTFFRHKHGSEVRRTTLQRVRAVCEPTLPAYDFPALAREVAKAAATLRPAPRRQRLEALAETCLSHGQAGLAQTYLEKAGTQASLTRLGDLLAEKKRWQQAAERYGQAWNKEPSQPLPLFLRGWSLAQAGLKQEGRKLMDRAHLMLLARDGARNQFAKAFNKRGLEAAAQYEWELIDRTGQFNELALSNAVVALRLAAYKAKDFERASLYHTRQILMCLGTFSHSNPGNYLANLSFAHYLRARALLARGKIDEAIKEGERARAALPGNTMTLFEVIPALEKEGRKKKAEVLYSQAFAYYAKLCKTYSKGAEFHNNIAWLSVCCRRDPDKALAFSRKAVALAPRNAMFIDTLAEIYYQGGNKARAIRLMKECIRLDPEKAYYKKQLRRFEARGPRSETPHTEND